MKIRRTLIRKVIACGLLFFCWIMAVRWADAHWDKEFWAFWFMVSAAAAAAALYGVRRSVRADEQAAHAQRQMEVLRLAETQAGRLTATRTALRLEWPMRVALATLRSLEDGVRVRTLVTSEGVRVYEFPELIHASAPHDRVR